MLFFFCIGVFVVVLGMLASYFLGPQHATKATNMPYESGIAVTGSARVRFPAHFYIVAILFVIFDLETVFIYAWGLCVRELGWRGFCQISVFIVVLLIALVYLLRNGALNIGPRLRLPGED